MARSEKPLSGPRHQTALAIALRDLRDEAGLTYDQMALRAFSIRTLEAADDFIDSGARPGIMIGGSLYRPSGDYASSAATLKRTASGTSVPKWSRVHQFRSICYFGCQDTSAQDTIMKKGANLRALWVRARMEERGTLQLKQPHPEYIADRADLSHALYALYEWQGAPPLREVQRAAGGPLHLPLTTLSRIVTRQALPVDPPRLQAYLQGCRVPDRHYAQWHTAWAKATQKYKTPREGSFAMI